MTARLARMPSALLMFLVWMALAGAVASRWSVQLGLALAPWFEDEIRMLDDSYRIDGLYVDREGADEVFRLRVGQQRYIVIRDKVFAPHPLGKAQASTLLGHVVLTGVLFISVALAWPARRRRVYGMRALAIPLALALLWAIDVPMILWGAIWSLHVDAFAPDLFSPLLIWCQFLQGGGRIALTVLLAALIGTGTNALAS